MFGGSNSGGGGPIGNPRPSSTPCKELSFRTHLSSPKPSILGKIKVGDILLVAIDSSSGSVVVKKSNQIAGTITSSSLHLLIECLRKGITFIAEVINISGGSCELEIRAV